MRADYIIVEFVEVGIQEILEQFHALVVREHGNVGLARKGFVQGVESELLVYAELVEYHQHLRGIVQVGVVHIKPFALFWSDDAVLDKD